MANRMDADRLAVDHKSIIIVLRSNEHHKSRMKEIDKEYRGDRYSVPSGCTMFWCATQSIPG